MKFFEKQFILKSINEMGKVWTDAFLTCLCIHKELHLKDDSAKESWHQINKDSLKNNLAYYFDLHEKELLSQNNTSKDYLSIIFAQKYESQIQQAEICYLAALCFRKQGIPENINDVQSLKDHLIKEFYLPPHFQTRLKNTLTLFPTFVNQSTNDDVVETLLDGSGKGKDKAESLSLGSKKILGDSAGNLGAAYFQTIYSKMNSQICLVTSVPDQYPINIANESLIDGKKDAEKTATHAQKIYYGVPGCGKSNKIKDLLQNVPEYNKIRVVFHPEYTNADFVGQIMPVVNNGIHYDFTPGPFSQILKRAYLKPSDHFYLVIEEINRGNAAAIFGDTFQLLDRLKAGETDALGNDPANAHVNTFTEGWSQYFVQNADLNAYIRKATQRDNGSYDENNDGIPLDHIQIGNIHFDSNTAIRIPPNLSILATMNTSDQNVFTLDNAFQRRFDMELVRNEFEKGEDANQYEGYKTEAILNQHNAVIAGTNVSWGFFWEWVNGKITTTLKGLKSTEDKRLGVWFVSNVNCVIDHKVFAEKVLKYLWDDVFKFKRSEIFADDIDTLEKLIKKFEEPEEGETQFAVFKNFLNVPNPGAV